LVGPKAKSIYKKNKALDLERRIINKGKVTKEEKIEMAEAHIRKKDK